MLGALLLLMTGAWGDVPAPPPVATRVATADEVAQAWAEVEAAVGEWQAERAAFVKARARQAQLDDLRAQPAPNAGATRGRGQAGMRAPRVQAEADAAEARAEDARLRGEASAAREAPVLVDMSREAPSAAAAREVQPLSGGAGAVAAQEKAAQAGVEQASEAAPQEDAAADQRAADERRRQVERIGARTRQLFEGAAGALAGD